MDVFRSTDDDTFLHVKEWYGAFPVNPCSKTETIHVLSSYRSEEPVTTNMDITTGHIILVS